MNSYIDSWTEPHISNDFIATATVCNYFDSSNSSRSKTTKPGPRTPFFFACLCAWINCFSCLLLAHASGSWVSRTSIRLSESSWGNYQVLKKTVVATCDYYQSWHTSYLAHRISVLLTPQLSGSPTKAVKKEPSPSSLWYSSDTPPEN